MHPYYTAAYHVPNWEINNIGVMSHKPPYATFRGPGKGPAIFIMESMTDHLARSLNLDVEDVKRKNLYRMGQVSFISPRQSVSQYQNEQCRDILQDHTHWDDPEVLQHFFTLES